MMSFMQLIDIRDRSQNSYDKILTKEGDGGEVLKILFLVGRHLGMAPKVMYSTKKRKNMFDSH